MAEDSSDSSIPPSADSTASPVSPPATDSTASPVSPPATDNPPPTDSTPANPSTSPLDNFASWGWSALSTISSGILPRLIPTEASKITKQIETTASDVYKTLDPDFEKEEKLRAEVDGRRQPEGVEEPDTMKERVDGEAAMEEGDFIDTLDRTFDRLGNSISTGFTNISKQTTQMTKEFSQSEAVKSTVTSMNSSLSQLKSTGTMAFSDFTSLFAPPVAEEKPLAHATTFIESFELEGGIKSMQGLEKLASAFPTPTTQFISYDFSALVVEDDDIMAPVQKFDQEMKRMLHWDGSASLAKLVDTLRIKREDVDGVWEGAFVAGCIGVMENLAEFLVDMRERDGKVEGRGARFCEIGKVCSGVEVILRWVVHEGRKGGEEGGEARVLEAVGFVNVVFGGVGGLFVKAEEAEK